MWYVYFLENKSHQFLYIGSTNDLKRRLAEHNRGLSRATKPYIPLTLAGYIALPSARKARRLEKYFKTGSGKVILKKRILQAEVPI